MWYHAGIAPSTIAEKETARLEAFSDGVFSIAMTLLVLELKVPRLEAAGSPELFRALAGEWPSYLAFTVTFITVLIMWINHHGIFRGVRRTSPELFISNGLLLLLVTTTPFTTALVARFLDTPAAPAATAVYCGGFVLMSASFNWLWAAATGCSEASPRDKRVTRNYRIGFPVYCLAAASSFWHPGLALGICMALWVFWVHTMREG